MATQPELKQVQCKYGAPMGRGRRGLSMEAAIAAANGRPFNGKVSLRRVKLNSGGYDSGGAYWGLGQPLYWAGDDSGAVDMWFRASSRGDAKDKVVIRHPHATFYR